jgi:hypothetical protein
MATPLIPSRQKLIPLAEVPTDSKFHGIHMVRVQSDSSAMSFYNDQRYEFQHEPAKRHMISGATLSLKGAPSKYRLVALIHPTLREFVDIVKYDPANPPTEDYDAIGMKEAHDETQSDFKNAKAKNLDDYKTYNLEALRGERVAYLPAITGWQSHEVFSDTVFVAFDENNPLVLYGALYLPKKPIMQSDGQTQTASLFGTATTGMAIKTGALDAFSVTLEIELDVEKRAAAQSFADRNGRGSKKNKNLVSRYDTAAGIAQLRDDAIAGTVFEHRLADGRSTSTGTTETQTANIVDLSTMEQMLLAALSNGRFKPEHIKSYQVPTLLSHGKDFLELLDSQFSAMWVQDPEKDEEPFRRLYVHGWPFCLKAIANAYYKTHVDELAPICDAIAASLKDEHESPEGAKSAFERKIVEAQSSSPTPDVTPTELGERLAKISWYRYNKPWVKITGAKLDKKTGQPKRRGLKSGEIVIDSKAENTKANIAAVEAKLLSSSWTDLESNEIA